MSGTARLVNNMVRRCFHRVLEKKTGQLIGGVIVPKRKAKVLELIFGFSHPTVYEMPEGVFCSNPSQTEIVLTGAR